MATFAEIKKEMEKGQVIVAGFEGSKRFAICFTPNGKKLITCPDREGDLLVAWTEVEITHWTIVRPKPKVRKLYPALVKFDDQTHAVTSKLFESVDRARVYYRDVIRLLTEYPPVLVTEEGA